MGLTGVIFGVIVAAWLVYLVPYFLHHRVDTKSAEAEALVAPAGVTIVRTGEDLATADEGVDVLPLTCAEQLSELATIDRRAAKRRRIVLIVLLVLQSAAVGVMALGIGPWWAALIPTVLIVVFLIIARVTVRAMRADLACRAESIRAIVDEETVSIKLTGEDVAEHEQSIDLTEHIGSVGSLWDAIPITQPTYVSTPIAPRTVRTIDLTPPRPMPVVAEAPERTKAKHEVDEDSASSQERRKAV